MKASFTLVLLATVFAIFHKGYEQASAKVASAAAGPYSGTLVFQSDRNGNYDIVLIEADGTNLRLLTRHPAHDMQPDFSPRGDRIAFTSERTGGGDIYVMNSDGSGLRRLTDHRAYEGAPSWSPDGEWIAFDGERDGRQSELYRVEVTTRRVERLTDSFSRKLSPDISPDGSALVHMDRGLVRWNVVLMDLASGSSRILTTGWGNCRPVWSPDGRLVAFVSTRESNKADIWFRDMSRDTSWKLHTRPDAHNYDPSFSPDGLALALASTIERPREQWDLFLVDINGRNLVQLTSGPENDQFPDWRPEAEAQ